jgi:hypothetical protein
MITGLTGQMQANADREKQEVIGVLVANQSTFSAEDLGKMDLPQLLKLRMVLTPADYSLRGLPMAVNSGDDGWVEYEVPANGAPAGEGGAK